MSMLTPTSLERTPVPPRYTADEAEAAHSEWGFNCGPGAIAVVAAMTPSQIRVMLFDFESKRYTNPTLMWRTLSALRLPFRVRMATSGCPVDWPRFGLARIQWKGPWTKEGANPRWAYGYTHWVAVDSTLDPRAIFDVNASKWIAEAEWSQVLVPWILKECHPKANGEWFITHAVEIERRISVQRFCEYEGVITHG